MNFTLEKFQADFVYSPKDFPAMVSSWGTGKTLCLILRAMLYSKGIPENLGMIFRKEYVDLRDSTIKDFEKYTGIKVDSKREAKIGTSTIMFRHIEDLNNIQNVNLGWFAIEQGDELDSDNEFFTLWGRMRRNVKPDESFKSLGLPNHSGFVIANAGDHWMKTLWKDKKMSQSGPLANIINPPSSELIEATTYDNAKNLPEGFIQKLEALKVLKPEIYQRFVMNDWNVSDDRFQLIKPAYIEALRNLVIDDTFTRRIIAIDPATGGDDCVVLAMENYRIIDKMVLHYNDTMKIVAEIMMFSNKHHINDMAGDVIGVGKGVLDRLEELGKRVIKINSSENAKDRERYFNLRTEMWCECSEKILRREIPYIEDEKVRKQLTAVRYRIIDSSGKQQLEPKAVTKKRLNESPDHADAFIYGVHGLGFVEQSSGNNDMAFSGYTNNVWSGAGGY